MQQPPTNLPNPDTNKVDLFSVLAIGEADEIKTREEHTPNNNNTNQSNEKNVNTAEPINFTDNNEFPPLIGNSFENQRDMIKAIIRPQ